MAEQTDSRGVTEEHGGKRRNGQYIKDRKLCKLTSPTRWGQTNEKQHDIPTRGDLARYEPIPLVIESRRTGERMRDTVLLLQRLELNQF